MIGLITREEVILKLMAVTAKESIIKFVLVWQNIMYVTFVHFGWFLYFHQFMKTEFSVEIYPYLAKHSSIFRLIRTSKFLSTFNCTEGIELYTKVESGQLQIRIILIFDVLPTAYHSLCSMGTVLYLKIQTFKKYTC